MVSSVIVTARNVPGPVATQVGLVESQAEGTSELVVSEGAIPVVVPACIEPSTVLRINKESFSGTNVFIARDREYFGRSITRGCLGGIDAHFVAVVEYQAVWAAVLKDGVVILVLVELDTAIEARAIFWVSVVTLTRTLKDGLRVLSDALDSALTVHDADNPTENESKIGK